MTVAFENVFWTVQLISQLYQFLGRPTKPFSLKRSFVKSWRTVSYAIIFYSFEMDNISQLWHLLKLLFFIIGQKDKESFNHVTTAVFGWYRAAL